MPANDYLSFGPQSKILEAPTGNFADAFSVMPVSAVVFQWRYYFENFFGSDCAVTKNAWDTVGFAGLALGTPIIKDGNVLAHLSPADITLDNPGYHPEWGDANNWAARFTQRMTLNDLSETSFNYGRSNDDPAIINTDDLPAGPFVMGGDIKTMTYDMVNTPDQDGNGGLYMNAPVTYDEMTGVVDSEGLFYFIFPECGVTPPTGKPIFGMLYDVALFPGPQVSFPPFNTRLPYQNFTRSVSTVFLKRK